MKILICFGTRPEGIKMAPIIFELERRRLPFKVCVTGQHREMLDHVLEFFGITPDFDLNLMTEGQSLNSFSSKLLMTFDGILEREEPSLVLVHGDTNSSSILALAAFYRGIKVGHVEAGLRTYSKNAPFPEEINRQITARIADFHFAPTSTAQVNLLNEKIDPADIFVTGNTIVDALSWARRRVNSDPTIKNNVKELIKFSPSKKLILVTGHRRENFGEGLRNICKALLLLAERNDIVIIYSVHLNPKVQEVVYPLLGGKKNIFLTGPVSYSSMLYLMEKSEIIISDSGGIQEEAISFEKPVLVTREVTERMEGVEAGFSFLVGSNEKLIYTTAINLLDKPLNLSGKENPFGDGKASEKIVDIISRS